MCAAKYPIEFISKKFVEQYYEVLVNKPSELYKFYLNDASFSHVENAQKSFSVIGSDKIQKITSEFNLPLTTSDFLQGKIDCQSVGTNSILVIVSGYAQSINGYFFHTFILVEQSKAFFVSNSAFRILPNLTQQIPELIETKPIEQPQPEPIKEVVVQPEPIQEVVAQPEPTQPVVEVSEPVNVEPEAEEVPEVQETEPEIEAQPESDPSTELEASSGTKSYLDIVKKIRESSTQNAAPKKVQKPAVKKTEIPVAVEPTPAAASSTPAANAPSSKQQEFAIFVRELPENVSESEVIAAFSQFGEVLKVDRVKARNYGFIKFQTNEGKQNALAYGQPVDIKGVSIKIEERTPSGKPTGKNGKDKAKNSKESDRKSKSNSSSKPKNQEK